MNNADKEYQNLLRLILNNGRRKKNRTGVDTIGVFGAQARFDLSEGFPLLTTKKVHYKAIIHELLWFIKGDTNIKYLVDNGVNIWNKDAYRRFKERADVETNACFNNEERFVNQIKSNKSDESFAKTWGELGNGTYGGMWRKFPYASLEAGNQHEYYRVSEQYVDQLSKAIEKLKTNPDDRRIIVSAWHPYYVDHCVLPPCHVLFHFNTEELTLDERWALFKQPVKCLPRYIENGQVTEEGKKDTLDEINAPTRRLNCLMYQRSCDTFLGVPFNIASYALLTEMVAHCVNMVAGEFIHTYGDLHIYENHLKQVEEQLSREPLELPKLKLNPEVRDLFAFKFDDIEIENYQSHPPIKGEMST